MEMRSAKLLHNPEAGEGEITSEELITLVEEAGFECNYASTKKNGWDKLNGKKIDFIVVAGGDGTVRKVAKKLLRKKLVEKRLPLALLPLGTANNIAKALDITDVRQEIIKAWGHENLKKYDIGRIYGLKDKKFFIEGLGYGVLSELMHKMSDKDEAEKGTPEKKMSLALETLAYILEIYKPKACKLSIDGVDYSGKYLMVEIMNTKSVGPNLILSPQGDPGDGLLDVVLIKEDQRKELAAYVKSKIDKKESSFFSQPIKAKKVKIEWDDIAHIDDELTDDQCKEIKVEVLTGVLEFYV